MGESSGRTAADLATGWASLIGPAIAVSIALYTYVLFEPLLSTRVLLFARNEIVLIRVAYELYNIDLLLFLIVFLSGIVAPGVKLIAFAVFWYGFGFDRARRHNRWLVLLGKVAHAEVMLIALLVVAIKGIGIGAVEIKPGLYFYIALVSGSFVLSLGADHELKRLWESAPRPLQTRDAPDG